VKYYNVGKIVNTHGIRGEVKVVSTTDFPEERFQPKNNSIFKHSSRFQLPSRP
jgi:RimM protein, required for 16S rRNA processing